MSTWETIRTFGKYFRQGENRVILKALAYKYGAPFALTAAAVGVPVLGWMVAAAGALPVWLLARHGDKMIARLEANGALSRNKGPFAAFINIVKNITEPVQDSAKRIMGHWNEAVDDLFADSKVPNVDRLRRGLKIKTDSRIAGMLGHAINVQLHFAKRWQGKISRGLIRFGSKLRFGPLKWPFIVIGVLWHGMLMLATHRKLSKAAVNVVA